MLTITTPPPAIDSANERALVMRVSGPVRTFTTATFIKLSQINPPESFLAGWADYEAGRIVDMDRALEDEPPPAV